ncbi:MAG: hypothetical protein HC890_12585 [Chloroflexaceae bacterium]|nr:hypothetical protein [Chloroflexaceae bacterium]
MPPLSCLRFLAAIIIEYFRSEKKKRNTPARVNFRLRGWLVVKAGAQRRAQRAFTTRRPCGIISRGRGGGEDPNLCDVICLMRQ